MGRAGNGLDKILEFNVGKESGMQNLKKVYFYIIDPPMASHTANAKLINVQCAS